MPFFVLAACAAVQPAPERHEFRQLHMGVETRILLYSADSALALDAARAAFRRVGEVDAMMSDYRDDSELVRLSSHPPGEWVPVSEPLWRVLVAARELSERSGGAFDVTVGPLIRLWREARRTGRYPGPAALDSARSASGWRRLEFDPLRRAVRLTAAGMRLDLGGIAKGFAVDEALRVLRAHGVSRALVEMGGDIGVGDPPPGRAGWVVRIADAAGAPPVVELANAVISTSGDAAQYVVIDGVRLSHVIDPRTGLALQGRSAATVIAPSGLLTDPLSTALGVLGPEAGNEFLRRAYPGVRAYVRRLD